MSYVNQQKHTNTSAYRVSEWERVRENASNTYTMENAFTDPRRGDVRQPHTACMHCVSVLSDAVRNLWKCVSIGTCNECFCLIYHTKTTIYKQQHWRQGIQAVCHRIVTLSVLCGNTKRYTTAKIHQDTKQMDMFFQLLLLQRFQVVYATTTAYTEIQANFWCIFEFEFNPKAILSKVEDKFQAIHKQPLSHNSSTTPTEYLKKKSKSR